METAKQILTTLLSKLALFNDWLLDPTNQLLGILLGSFFTLIGVYLANKNTLRLAKLQNSHTHDIERNNLKREKLEELYLQISQWNKILSSKSISHVSAMNGDITYNQYLDIFNADARETEFRLERLDLLLDVYAQDIKEFLEVCKEYRKERIDPLESAFRKHYEDYGAAYGDYDKKEKISSYIVRCSTFEDKIAELKLHLAQKIRDEINRKHSSYV